MVIKKKNETRTKISKGRLSKVVFLSLDQLTPNPENAREHDREQIRLIAESIKAFGFTAPILVDRDGKIIVGHARYQAALYLELSTVPVIYLDHLTDVQVKAYMLADNQLASRSNWNDKKLAIQLKELSELALDFDLAAIGFDAPEIDFRIQSLDTPDDVADIADEFKVVVGPAVSVVGDLWLFDDHRVYCGSALDAKSYTDLMGSEKAGGVFADPPYNDKIFGHVGGKGSIRHREFAMASGEMTETEFTEFLTASMTLICANTTAGAIIYTCMDWRHMGELLSAGRLAKCDLLNVCVWAKSNGGMGSLYRSRHELVFVFRNGKEAHINNVQLGRFGRYRTNVWNYPGVNTFPRKGSKRVLDLHPTVKPIALVSDAMLDSTNRDGIVLDPFLGSGTTLLAAERTGRRCYGIEIDPLYVDTAIERWQRTAGREVRNPEGETFAEVKSRRGAAT